MDRQGPVVGRALPSVLLTGLVLAAALSAHPQAWPLPKGIGSVSLTYQRIDNTGHRDTLGELLEVGQSVSDGLVLDFEYGVTRRLSVSAAIPLVRTKYTGGPPPPPIPYFAIDSSHEWQSGFQDFGFNLRYNALEHGPLVLTPLVAVTLPSHDYNYRGEATIGYGLKEIDVGLAVGRRLDEITPALYVQVGYRYAFVEQAGSVDVPNNRSQISAAAGYDLTSKLSVRGTAQWQHTHGGLRFGGFPPDTTLPFPGEVNTPERLAEHDRLLRDNHFHLGGGLSYSIGRTDLFANYTHYVSGTDAHDGHAWIAGMAVYFGALSGPSNR